MPKGHCIQGATMPIMQFIPIPYPVSNPVTNSYLVHTSELSC